MMSSTTHPYDIQLAHRKLKVDLTETSEYAPSFGQIIKSDESYFNWLEHGLMGDKLKKMRKIFSISTTGKLTFIDNNTVVLKNCSLSLIQENVTNSVTAIQIVKNATKAALDHNKCNLTVLKK